MVFNSWLEQRLDRPQREMGIILSPPDLDLDLVLETGTWTWTWSIWTWSTISNFDQF